MRNRVRLIAGRPPPATSSIVSSDSAAARSRSIWLRSTIGSPPLTEADVVEQVGLRDPGKLGEHRVGVEPEAGEVGRLGCGDRRLDLGPPEQAVAGVAGVAAAVAGADRRLGGVVVDEILGDEHLLLPGQLFAHGHCLSNVGAFSRH